MNDMEISKYIIDKDEKLISAIKRMNDISGIGLYVCENTRLIGTLTDGDVRRWLISHKNIDTCVERVASKEYCCLKKNDANMAYDMMKERYLKSIAIVDDSNNIIDIIVADAVGVSKKMRVSSFIDCPAVIMAGGRGTRLYPYTKVLPKPLIPIGETPVVEHIIENFYSYGVNKYFMIVNHMKNMIKSFFSEQERPYEIDFVEEESPLGTGGGLSFLKDKINETFILTNCDILIRDNLYEAYKYHKENNCVITMICALKKEQIPYGVVEIDNLGNLISMKEKPEITFFTNTGCYFVEPKVIDDLDYGIKIDFPEIIEKYRSNGEKIGVFPISPESWLDMGQPDKLNEMKRALDND